MTTRVERFLHDNNQRLWRSYEYVRKACCDDAATRLVIGPPFYTDHGVQHSIRMLEMLDLLVFDPWSPWLVHRELTPSEAYVVMCGIFTHDLGMRGSALVGMHNASEARNRARQLHHEFSSKIILQDKHLVEWDKRLFPHDDLRKAIAEICYCHALPVVLLDPQIRQRAHTNHGVDLDFCAAMLKALDCMDITNRRLGFGDIRNEAIPPANIIHMWAHYYIDDLILEHREISVEPYLRIVIGIKVRYSLPLMEWPKHAKNASTPRSLDRHNPFHQIRALGEKNIRALHTNVPEILQTRGIYLVTDLNDIVINHSLYDSDGGRKRDFKADFLDAISHDDKAKVDEVIDGAVKRFRGILDESDVGFDRRGCPKSDEYLQVLRHLQRFPSLPVSRDVLDGCRPFETVFRVLARQGILKEVGNAYQLDSESEGWQESVKTLTRFLDTHRLGEVLG